MWGPGRPRTAKREREGQSPQHGALPGYRGAEGWSLRGGDGGSGGDSAYLAETRVLPQQGVELAMDLLGRSERVQLNLESGGRE